MADTARRSWLQFSLRTVLWIMLCVGIGFGTYRQGFQEGRDYREPLPKPPFGHAQIYYVEDLIASGGYQNVNNGLQDIRQQIASQVTPNSWTESGGTAVIRTWETNCSLVVINDRTGHEQVASYLKSLRDRAPKSEAKAH